MSLSSAAARGPRASIPAKAFLSLAIAENVLKAWSAPRREEAFMKRLAFVALTAGAAIGTAGAASAQTFYFGFSTHPYPPPPYYGPPPRYYGPPPDYAPPYYGPRRYYRDYDEPRYYRYGYGERGYYYSPGRYRTWNGCQPGWTVQDGLCKPYRGY